jgi:hypothetical protein
MVSRTLTSAGLPTQRAANASQSPSWGVANAATGLGMLGYMEPSPGFYVVVTQDLPIEG